MDQGHVGQREDGPSERRRDRRRRKKEEEVEEERARNMMAPRAPSVLSILKVLGVALDPYLLHLVFGMAVSSLAKAVQLMIPIVLGAVIDVLHGRKVNWVSTLEYYFFGEKWSHSIQQIHSTSLILALGLVAAMVIHSILKWLHRQALLTLGQGTSHSLRMEMFERLQHGNIAFVEQNRPADVQQLLVWDCQSLEMLLTTGLCEGAQLLAALAFSGLVLLRVSSPLALLALSPLPFVLLMSFFWGSRLSRLREDSKDLDRQLQKRLASTCSPQGVVTARSFAAETLEYNRIAGSSRSLRQCRKREQMLESSYDSIVGLMTIVGSACVLILGGSWILQTASDIIPHSVSAMTQAPGLDQVRSVQNGMGNEGGQQEQQTWEWIFSFRTDDVTVGDLIIFILMAPMVLQPLAGVGHMLQHYRSALDSLRKMASFFDSSIPAPTKIFDDLPRSSLFPSLSLSSLV